MGHNVWSHINAVQEANRQYDKSIVPNMLVQEKYDRVFFRDVVEEIFSKSTKEESFEVIKNHEKFLMSIRGTRGYTGKNIISARSKFAELFDEVEDDVETQKSLLKTKFKNSRI